MKNFTLEEKVEALNRLENGMSRADLCKELGISFYILNFWINDKESLKKRLYGNEDSDEEKNTSSISKPVLKRHLPCSEAVARKPLKVDIDEENDDIIAPKRIKVDIDDDKKVVETVSSAKPEIVLSETIIEKSGLLQDTDLKKASLIAEKYSVKHTYALQKKYINKFMVLYQREEKAIFKLQKNSVGEQKQLDRYYDIFLLKLKHEKLKFRQSMQQMISKLSSELSIS